MKFKVGDKVKYKPNYCMRDNHVIAVVEKIIGTKYQVRVRFYNWIKIPAWETELTLLSPVIAALYEWDEGNNEV